VRLIACQTCHTQYDVTLIIEKEITCRCGEKVENRDLEAMEARIHRCGSCGAQVGHDASGCDYCGSSIERDEAKLSLICPECYGRNAQDARFCAACGVTFDPEPVEAEGIELPCPCCTSLMPAAQIGGIGINECTGCNGLWVPGDKFDLLVDRTIEVRRQAKGTATPAPSPRVKGNNPYSQKVKYRKCPECDGFMQRRNFRKSSGVIVDRCQHGTWLDADELEQIAGFILSGGRPRAEEIINRPEKRTLEVGRAASGSVGRRSESTLGFGFDSSNDIGGSDLFSTLLRVFTKSLIS
jgi:Zn-finger nucleic acid-binding protein